jgi:YtkA-like
MFRLGRNVRTATALNLISQQIVTRSDAIADESGRRWDTMTRQLCAAIAALGIVAAPLVYAAPQDYRFELSGVPTAAAGKSIVQLRLVHVPDKKPVTGAVVFEVKADMGPDGMPTMAAPAKALPETTPGVYRVAVQPDMAGNYAITVAAKVQGETETVRGSVTARLKK